jgi:hypothetical protein
MGNVRRSRTLIFILTEQVFQSQWALEELQEAAECGLNIVMVHAEGHLWNGREFPPWSIVPPNLKKAFEANKAIEHKAAPEAFKQFIVDLKSAIGRPLRLQERKQKDKWATVRRSRGHDSTL